jgi:hypothetical protein
MSLKLHTRLVLGIVFILGWIHITFGCYTLKRCLLRFEVTWAFQLFGIVIIDEI